MVDFRGKPPGEEKKEETPVKPKNRFSETNTDRILRQLGDVQKKINVAEKRMNGSNGLHPNDRRQLNGKIEKLKKAEAKLKSRLRALGCLSDDYHPSWEI